MGEPDTDTSDVQSTTGVAGTAATDPVGEHSAIDQIVDLSDFDPSTLPPITRAALGMVRGLPDRPYKELLVKALLEKYGLDA